MVMRLADADLLPFEFTNLADTVQTYVRELQALLKTQQDDVRERNRQIEEGVFAAIHDARQPRKAPAIEDVAPAINFAPLENAANALTRAADRYHKAAEATRTRLGADTVRRVNARLIQSEQQLLDPAGLPGRPWYRHLLYAPGFYTGYAVKTMPGVREGMEQKRYAEAEAQIVRVAAALDRETALIDAAAAEIERVTASH
jgi:N-acetylated-alpha-linked acidic dipeptidase